MFLLWFDGMVYVLSAELGDGEGAAKVGNAGLAGMRREGLDWGGWGAWGLRELWGL